VTASALSRQTRVHSRGSDGHAVESRAADVECDGGETHEDALAVRTGSGRRFRRCGISSRWASLRVARSCSGRSAAWSVTQCRGRGIGVGLPVIEWDAVGDPLGLVGKMWNHIPQMRTEIEKRNIRWPSLNPQGTLRHHGLRTRASRGEGRAAHDAFDLPPTEGGESLVQAHGCATCHKGALEFDRRRRSDPYRHRRGDVES
jgi:hypothetical protein